MLGGTGGRQSLAVTHLMGNKTTQRRNIAKRRKEEIQAIKSELGRDKISEEGSFFLEDEDEDDEDDDEDDEENDEEDDDEEDGESTKKSKMKDENRIKNH